MNQEWTKARYATALLPIVTRIVEAVHDEGPDELREALAAAKALPAPDDVDPTDAIAVILAAMVDPAGGLAALMWVRGLKPVHISPIEVEVYDESTVVRCLAGDLAGQQLRIPDRIEIVKRAHSVGWNDQEIERRTGISSRTAIRVRKQLGLAGIRTSAPPAKAGRTP